MVWIHGGAFNTGGAVTYADPAPLVSKGALVVAINYRLGPLGFLGDASLEDANGAVGDYGIMGDQQAALRWVKRTSRSSAATRTTPRSSANRPVASAS